MDFYCVQYSFRCLLRFGPRYGGSGLLFLLIVRFLEKHGKDTDFTRKEMYFYNFKSVSMQE